jgi:hypothetical protein
MNSIDPNQRFSSLLEELVDFEHLNANPMPSEPAPNKSIFDTSEFAKTFQQLQASQRSLTHALVADNTASVSSDLRVQDTNNSPVAPSDPPPPPVQPAESHGGSFLDGIFGGISNAFHSVVDWVGGAAKSVGHAFSSAASSVWDGIKSVGHGIADAAKWVGHGIADAAKWVGHGVADAAKWVGHGVVDAAKWVGHGVVDAAKWVGHGVADAAKWVGHGVADAAKWFAPRAWDAIRGLGTGIWGAAKGIVQDVIQGGGQFFGGIGKIFKGDFLGGLKDMGLGLLHTFVQTPVDAIMMVGARAISAVQTMVGLEPPGRKLTSDEIATLRSVYGDSIDYSQIRIKEGNSGLFSVAGRALTQGNTIYVPKGELPLSKETLVHEAAHVWQYEHGGTDYMAEALWGQNFGEGYDFSKGIDEGKSFSDLNPEQQAELVQEAYASGFFYPTSPNFGTFKYTRSDGTVADYTDYVKKAMDQIHSGEGAP